MKQESEVERAVRQCTDPAILAASPKDQYLYHLRSFSAECSSVAFGRLQRMSARLRARYQPTEEDDY